MISKKLVLTAFSVCIVFSILLASIAYLTLRDIKKDIEIQKVADSIVKTAFKINIDEREYRLNPYKKNKIKEHLKELKKPPGDSVTRKILYAFPRKTASFS